MSHTHKFTPNSEQLAERCALLEEKNRDLIARVRVLSEENRSSDGLIRALLENTPFGIVMFDNKQRVMQINRAAEEILQVQRVNVIGKSCETVFNCFTEYNHHCPVLHQDKTLDRIETNYRSVLCNCDRHLLRSVVRLENNNEPVLVEAFVDISSIKQAQLEIENANQTKDIFLSKVSHELRTPLNIILGFTGLLKDSAAIQAGSDNALYLNNILRSSKKMLRMVDEVLDITRITAQRIKLDEYLLEIPGILQQVRQEVSEQCEEHGNTLTINCAADARHIYADPVRLQQILYHLLDNACRYTQQGEIVVNIERRFTTTDGQITFSIMDTGEGMSAEQQSRVFSEFEQADTGHTRRYNGAGLGLTLCKQISRLMGGEIKVSSELGVGSEFILLLPDKLPAATK